MTEKALANTTSDQVGQFVRFWKNKATLSLTLDETFYLSECAGGIRISRPPNAAIDGSRVMHSKRFVDVPQQAGLRYLPFTILVIK